MIFPSPSSPVKKEEKKSVPFPSACNSFLRCFPFPWFHPIPFRVCVYLCVNNDVSLVKFHQIDRLEELRESITQVDKVNRFRHVVVEPCLETLILDITHDIRRQGDDG